ncbi:Meiosis-specific protein asy1 [Dionaea muscipula]
MVVAQKLQESEVTEQASLLLTRNLLRIAIYNISYIRGLFSEKYFTDKTVPALEMKIKKLMPVDPESRRLIDWMEQGVYDALQKKYLRTLLFCICESVGGPMIEEYSFSFSYSDSDSQEVSMNISRSGSKKQSRTFKCNSMNEVTPTQMRSSACKMIRTLVQLMRTLDKMPDERTILMKLFYYDEATPADYEPPFFRCCTAEEGHNQWTKNPLKMEVGDVNSKYFVLSLKVKSVLDPCEDDGEGDHCDDVSLGADSIRREDSSESETEVGSSQEDQYIIAPADRQQPCEEDTAMEQDNTQDPEEDAKQLCRVKDWICSFPRDAVEITDVLSSFPDISVIMIEEIIEKLVNQCILSKLGRDTYAIKRQKKSDYEFDVKEEITEQELPIGCKMPQGFGEDFMYMKALYHALPMDYVTVAKLQNKLGEEANQHTVRMLIDKMTKDGFVEAKSNRRLGKRVIHSELTEKKLSEVRKALDIDHMVITETDMDEPQSKLNLVKFHGTGKNHVDVSTCGGLHSIGSDLTRTTSRSEMHQNGSIRNEQTMLERELPNTPTSNALPVASRESTVPGKDNTRLNGNSGHDGDLICSRSSQEKRTRKTSLVKEPILQYLKRLKSQAV